MTQGQQPPRRPPLYTLGYQGRTLAGIRRIVEAVGGVLVDVRASPKSRSPQFNRSSFEREFRDAYVSRPDLGGIVHGRTVHSDGPKPEALRWLRERAATPGASPLVLMCMERAPGDCHRHRLITGPLGLEDAVHLFLDAGGAEYAVRSGDLAANLADESHEIPDTLFWPTLGAGR